MESKVESGRRTSRWALLSFSLAAACGGAKPAPPPEPQAPAGAALVLRGGDVWTMDPARPRVSAVAVRDGRIAALGSDEDVAALIGPDTRVVDLAGATVTPGLVDAHAHLYGLGKALEEVDLKGIASEREAAAVVGDAAAGRPAGEWITGRGWDQTLWSPQRFPSRLTLDAVAPEHPVAVRRVDGHALWANGAAMKRAGITRATPDPDGGRIVRSPGGEPTGVFIDAAMELIEQHVPAPSPEARVRRIERAAAVAVSVGLTGVHEMGVSPEVADTYRELAARGALPLRVYVFLSVDDPVGYMRDHEPDLGGADGRVIVRALKLFADGALGSRGAALLAPYADEPDNVGLTITPPAELDLAARTAVERGWQLGVHAIGDRGNRAVLDAYEVGAAHDRRFRVEHAQVLAPSDIPRFARLGVIASMQPTHCTSDMRWAEARLGPERVLGAYAWRALLDAGAALAFGSDFPVEDVAPLLGVYAAVTRQDRDGNPPQGWYPAQRLTLDEAIGGFTTGSAFAGYAEDRRGRLAVGLDADLTVFDRALAADRTLLDAGVAMTIVAGEVVYDRDAPRD